MPIFATASKEVSVYYGTLHRRESHISLLSLWNFPSLNISRFMPFSYTQISSIGMRMFNLSAICLRKYLSEQPFVLLMISLSDCFRPWVNILLTFLIFQGFTNPSYSKNFSSISKSGHFLSYLVPFSCPNTIWYSLLLKWQSVRIFTW